MPPIFAPRIREVGAAQDGQTGQRCSAAASALYRSHLVTVYPVIDYGDPVAGLSHVHKAVGHELEAGVVPRCVRMRRSR